MNEPCMCGATDCPNCYPYAQTRTDCDCGCRGVKLCDTAECDCGAIICDNCDCCRACAKRDENMESDLLPLWQWLEHNCIDVTLNQRKTMTRIIREVTDEDC